MYSYAKYNGENEKTAKGIRKYVIKKNTAHQDYEDTLQNNKQIYHTMKTIRSVCHQLGSYVMNSIRFNCPVLRIRDISLLRVELVMHMATIKFKTHLFCGKN